MPLSPHRIRTALRVRSWGSLTVILLFLGFSAAVVSQPNSTVAIASKSHQPGMYRPCRGHHTGRVWQSGFGPTDDHYYQGHDDNHHHIHDQHDHAHDDVEQHNHFVEHQQFDLHHVHDGGARRRQQLRSDEPTGPGVQQLVAAVRAQLAARRGGHRARG